MIKDPLVNLRKLIRSNISGIMQFVDDNYIFRRNDKAVVPDQPICMFCGSKNSITKEHIIPKWVFENDPKRFFNITLNGHGQSYSKSTIPACNRCNSELLNHLERKVQYIFNDIDPGNKPYIIEELEDIIRWLEIIDYKFHIMNISKHFLSLKGGDYIPYLKDFPLYMLLLEKDFSPAKALSEIRKTLHRITIKNKQHHLNSLLIFKTSNLSDHFFHTLNEFIFFEMPRHGVAIFYFLNQDFPNNEAAHDAAMEIIRKVY
jgi:hypothetical protein